MDSWQRLAEYEDIGSPEELRNLKSATAAFEGLEEPSEETIMFLQDGHQLRQWIKRCAWHCNKVNEQSIEIERLKSERDAADRNVEYLLRGIYTTKHGVIRRRRRCE